MRTEDETVIYLKDYQPAPYRIADVVLDVQIAPDTCIIGATLTVEPSAGLRPGTPLVLDGENIRLTAISIDGQKLAEGSYSVTDTDLTIHNPPARSFTLETEVELEPEKNTRLMGLYRSSGTWCTQCEPEGFRRITYFLDRPDNLATYRVRMTAGRKLAPVLLANGNLIATGEAGDGRHFATWEDPHPKPSYLFAMVAGDLGSIHDNFTTASGREVALGIYCAHGKEEQCLWAMDSLKRSMAWDERRFGREYDLDVFNIVAVSDFNFGAMENKGLNIFNDKLVFAEPATATDADFDNVERVIAHEYFHNWTGNRITCRDWFQLCLKEGLTVYRDQEFSSDERSRAVKRIADVVTLRATQFPEDGGPLAHPPRPDHYREINNFYTATVYEKGAEVVRMLATLLGEAGFRRGMDLYFERHDGEAATIEEFLAAFADANGVNLDHFENWYEQAGTPEITVSQRWDADSKSYVLNLRQETRPTPGQPDKRPQVVPIRFGLLGPNGNATGWTAVSGGDVRDDIIVLDSDEVTLRFEGVANRPVPSLFRGFSAPVKIVSDLTEEDRLFLARHDTDPFVRWQALQDVAMDLLVGEVRGRPMTNAAIDGLAQAHKDTIASDALDDAFKALAITLPSQLDVARQLAVDVDPDAIHKAHRELVRAIAGRIAGPIRNAYDQTASSEAYSPLAAQAGRRSLRNALLSRLVLGGIPGAAGLAERQYNDATNMTDRLAALSVLVAAEAPASGALLAAFRTRYGADPLVLDKWLSMVARDPGDGTIERMRSILAEPDFPTNNPNRLRALVGVFAMGNPVQFARADGAGFDFVADFVGEVDARNPQVAARVLTGFRVWQSFEPVRREKAREALERLAAHQGLSRNTSDILFRTLGRKA